MYTIHEVAEKCDLSVHTIRFYDKEGLLPFVTRNKSGNREFSEQSLELIRLICCLKNTGMPIKEIKQYVDLIVEGDSTSGVRRQVMVDHRKEVVRQMNELKKNLNLIDLKISHYDSKHKH
ncbi:DNA-binding transcriptional MerR regulator [Paenibacillus phyllosphaerae]|uniref:DNA-binding transcriptional MerR regulator n=1 Tax=Paenibacillus phyllosphaerae TaxID=274593 RepID=A0A7W5B5C7_9BACL|nr:MerR family transcriptional regulator [Paenibacillus phyllosphaerae]MBB3113931.1 DNA-binding transcriptional MerR regulator [Paenibacillus phyllosphaerae]